MIPILLKSINIEDYGIVGLYLGLVAIFTAILPMSAENALARSVFEADKILNRQVFETAIAVVIMMFLLSLTFIVLLRGWLTGPLFNISLLALISSVLQVFVNLILVQLQMREEVISYFLISVVQAILILGLTIYWLPTLGVWARYTSPIISLLVVLASYCALTNFKYVYFKAGFVGWDYVRKVGLPLTPHSLLNVSSLYIDRFFLKFFNYDILLGFYTISSQLINAVGGALSSVNNAYTPWVFNRLEQDKSLNFFGIIVILALVCFFMVLLTMWVSPLIPVGKYSVIVDSLYLIPIYVFFESTYYLTCPLLYFKKLGSSISTATFVSAVTKVVVLAVYLLFNEPTIDGILIILITSVAIKTLMTLLFVRINYESPSK
jgi:O-antigen/teichoic acid export membrane protein